MRENRLGKRLGGNKLAEKVSENSGAERVLRGEVLVRLEELGEAVLARLVLEKVV